MSVRKLSPHEKHSDRNLYEIWSSKVAQKRFARCQILLTKARLFFFITSGSNFRMLSKSFAIHVGCLSGLWRQGTIVGSKVIQFRLSIKAFKGMGAMCNCTNDKCPNPSKLYWKTVQGSDKASPLSPISLPLPSFISVLHSARPPISKTNGFLMS